MNKTSIIMSHGRDFLSYVGLWDVTILFTTNI